ncbi:MAG: hypothetical protein ABGZ36_01630 [Actinomycetota bacterium]
MFVPVFVLALVLLAMPPAVNGTPIARQGPSDDESRGLGHDGGEQAESEPQTSRFDDPEFADQQILDDLIVDGSICVGLDCVNGESFGFDTIRLKENNLRIRFFDTSTSASFPSNDWQITVNDSSNGGANKFSIDDIDGNRTPFTIEAGAPSHSLFVDDGGRIGLGTSTPVTEIHVKDGDSPTLRLEQDGSSGFTPQTWDVAGNETNFFIRDATNGSKLPFRIRPNAPSNSIFVDTDGDVGLQTSSPVARLDVRGASSGAAMNVEQPDQVQFQMTSTNGADDWLFVVDQTGTTNEGFSITRIGSGNRELRLTPTGAIVIPDAPLPNATAGTMYFDGNTFCGYDGTAWRPLQAAGDQTCN